MAFSPGPKDKAISIDVFGGLCTLQAPQSLPNGVSPDCQDVQFIPGSVFSRANLRKFLATPLGALSINYGKTYIDPTGIIRNFYLTSDGNFWMQIIAPVGLAAAPAVLFATTPGSYARSITAFGREFVAISDGFHGTEAPLQITGLTDGTVQIDRVTHDAPGAPPQVTNLIIPAVPLANTGGSNPAFTVAGVFPDQKVGSVYTALNIYYSAGTASDAPVGSLVVLSGLPGPFAVFDGTYTVIANPGPAGAIVLGTYYIGTQSGAATGALTVSVSGTSLKRTANTVLATTFSPHSLQVGYQSQISGVPAGIIGGGIVSLVINNESQQGLATVIMSALHGLVPGLNISISGVRPTPLGSISTITRAGGVVTVVLGVAGPVNLAPGAFVTIAGVTTAGFNTIAQVITASTTSQPGDTFTFAQPTYADAADSTGTVSINWPIPDEATPTFYQVISAPSPTVFQVAVNYADGIWASGTVSYAWDGQFYVASVPSPTTFTYQQYGPDDSAVFTAGQLETPFGQAAPGQHQMCVFFQDRQGGITAVSPAITFIANGGQYLSVTGIPIGPPGTVARGICFTGAEGAFFFYIPPTPQVNGQIVGTPTLIQDNTTTAAILDFGDTTLLEATGISIQGNNLPNQIVIDGALGFGYYASRLITWGQRNYIQPGGGAGGLLNMGFDGGIAGESAGTIQAGKSYTILSVGTTNFTLIGATSNTVGLTFTATGAGAGTGVVVASPALPAGWDGPANVGGTLVNGHFGQVWQVAVAPGGTRGQLSQSIYQTAIGAPIATGNTLYRIRGWFLLSAAAADLNFSASIESLSTGFITTATISGTLMPHGGVGAFLEMDFPDRMPSVIPADLQLTFYFFSSASSVTATVDDLFVMFAESPYFIDLYGSYAGNQTGFDGISGVFGPINDTHAVTDMAVQRESLNLLTRDPGGRLHVTADNGVTEPSGWTVDEVATECGALSAFSVTRSQADDSTSSGGEEWFAWASAAGMRIHSGGPVWKISEEIQPNWTGLNNINDATRSYPGINVAAAATIWCVNDPGQLGRPDTGRVIYVGLPIGMATSPSHVYQMDYKELDTAEQIAAADPVRVGFGGKLIATDHSRKWAPWSLAMNAGALLYVDANTVKLALFAGVPASTGPFGNVYTLDSTLCVDDDYGAFDPYYTIYFAPEHLEEQGLQLGFGRKQMVYISAFISGEGFVTLTPLCDTLVNPWPLVIKRQLSTNPKFDLEGPGTALGQRIAIRVSVSPS